MSFANSSKEMSPDPEESACLSVKKPGTSADVHNDNRQTKRNTNTEVQIQNLIEVQYQINNTKQTKKLTNQLKNSSSQMQSCVNGVSYLIIAATSSSASSSPSCAITCSGN
jgi:hypothetical protein